jgi:hypothetical protein
MVFLVRFFSRLQLQLSPNFNIKKRLVQMILHHRDRSGYRRTKRLVDENQAFTALIIIDGERTIVSGTKSIDDLGLRGKIA